METAPRTLPSSRGVCSNGTRDGLRVRDDADSLRSMSAREIIEQIKTLPKEEQNEVFAFVRHAGSGGAPAGVRFAENDEARKAGDAVVAQYSEVFQRLAE